MADHLLIKGGRVVDPSSKTDQVLDVLITNGKIARLAQSIEAENGTTEVLDATGKIVMPGFIDMHVHLREPGFEYKEDIGTGTRAAAMGGFTAVACMPNTQPACDTDTVVGRILERAKQTACVRVYPIGAVTKGRAGKELAEMGEMRAAGAVAFSDDGSPVTSAEVLRCALEYLKSFDAVLIDHPEDLSLSAGGQINYGLISTVTGLRGIPNESEEVAVARDLLIAKLTGGRLHLAHVSTKGSVELIRQAKAKGIRVTCEVTPHHLILTDETVLESGYDTNTKVNPPLRTQEDVAALRQALADGTIDAIATDHAPHHPDEKSQSFDEAHKGMVGFETAFALAVTELLEPCHIDLARLIELLSHAPRKIIHLPHMAFNPGDPADFTLCDLNVRWVVKPEHFASKAKNTPFGGRELTGRVMATFVGGRQIVENARFIG